MLTRLRIRNFKMFEDVDIELGHPVVLIGPNNCGKTTALQALALWQLGLRLWNAKREGEISPAKRPGVAINRRDLTQIPVPSAKLLWRRTNVRKGTGLTSQGKQRTKNIRIDITVDGISNDRPWSCGLELDYTNEESFVCRPLRQPEDEDAPVQTAKFQEIPREASQVKITYLPPMSGIAATEPKWEIGRINVLIGEGQTAQVIRNLCHEVHEKDDDTLWNNLVERIRELFGATPLPPRFLAERGEITMEYEDAVGTRLDLSSAGRGLQQTLLLLAHLYLNPGTVLLLDEPDAHLEILRQRETFRLISDLADQRGSQLIAASHSEVVLNEAAGRGKVVAFVGRPHVMTDRGSQVVKSLTNLGWDQYYQAEQNGWVLYLEAASDLSILQKLADTLEHEARGLLRRPFVHYVTNVPQHARDHFYGLREAKADLVGVALFDRLDKTLQETGPLVESMWSRREIENYLCSEEVLLAYARHDRDDQPNGLFQAPESEKRERAMKESINEVEKALKTLDEPGPWSADIKATDEFLDRVFKKFFEKLELPLTFRKPQYHVLAGLLKKEDIDPEVSEKLDLIVQVARKARPRSD